jgi:serine/threonine protein kinase
MNNTKVFNGKIDDYLITKELGKGSYAVVKLAMHKVTKNKYAIKIYSKQSLIDPQKRNTVKNEINILKQLDNDNIMKLYEVIDTSSNLYLVLEYINGINLLEIIKNEKYHFIKEERAKKLFIQVVKGIQYCHKKNIFHRDIKLENILVLKDDTIKIIDFGFGIKCNRDTYQKLFCGTPSYMPPEIVKKEKYIACYSDVWSLGVLFYAMLFGIFPFKGKDDDELFEKINEAKFFFPEYNKIGDKTKELFEKIFIVNPIQRISLDDMINMLEE